MSVSLLTVRAHHTVRPFNPEMLGSNVGIWTNFSYYPKADPRLIHMVKGAGLKVLRYPAGHEADLTYFDRDNRYSWQEGPAPYTRTMRADHLDAFIALARAADAEPLIIVNAKIDNPELAASLVRYVNIERGCKVKYFQVGNEPQYWKVSDPIDYADRVNRYAAAMKAVDPSIVVMNAGPAQPVSIEDWLVPVAERAGASMDAVTCHWYPLYDGAKDPAQAQHPSIDHLLTFDYGADASKYVQVGSIRYAERFVRTNPNSLLRLRDRYAPDALLAITELSPVAGGCVETGLADTFANALWFGDILGRLAYNGIDLVAQFLLLSEPQKYAMSDNHYRLRPVWYTYVMYHRYFGDRLVETASSDEQALTIWGSTKSGADDTLFVMVINKHTADAQQAKIRIEGFVPSTAHVWELTSSSINGYTAAINGVSVDEQAQLPQIEGKSISLVRVGDRDAFGDTFTYTFPAHSITCFELRR